MSKGDKKDYLYGESDWQFSLTKYVGKKIVDVIGYPADPFGGTPVFKITQIVFEDGTTVDVEGEHDAAYIPADDKLNNMDEETLQRFIDDD
jgi:hypothetical protein